MMKEDIIKRDHEYLWHPYTQMKDAESMPPIAVERAEGVKLYDIHGNFYYDTISSWWCNVHGHNHPAVKSAIKEQLDMLEHVLFAGFTHKPAVDLAERLVKITPEGLTKVFYSDNGSTSVEVAMKMSFQYWQNTKRHGKTSFVSLDRAYHGDTVGTMSVSGVDLFNKKFKPLFFNSYKAPSPYCYRCPKGMSREKCGLDCLNDLEEILKGKSENIAAMLVEPLLMAAGGMIIYPPEYLRGLERLSREYNVHLIVDEVATGFGRTGKMFACEYAGIKPDFLCLSKGVTSGYLPLGATLTTDRVFDAFYDDYENLKTFYHGHTYTANPLACSAGVASVDLFEKEGTLDNVKNISDMLSGFLSRMSELPIVGDVRHIGAVGAMELVRDRRTKASFPMQERIGLEVYKLGLDRNILLRPLGDVIYFFLPLCVDKDQLSDIFFRAEGVLGEINSKISVLS
ncbi:MAG: adenosylmethionine--8-amino-7-oxononanoate transaminase [Candidatus Omnitrophica bacterium]|nr:adenosylmethionine--8-amino-7-oxononanoate transaminase [Candidatus Omnitrophota bacterium]